MSLLTNGNGGVTDVWVPILRGGVGFLLHPHRMKCGFPKPNGPGTINNTCELIDKSLFYTQQFLKADNRFSTPSVESLSDHDPLVVPFIWG